MDLSERANMKDREVRTFDVELRATSEGRTIEGLAAPFNSPAEIRDAFGTYTETILPGAFTRTIQDRAGKIKLLASHDRQSFPLGNIPRLWEDQTGLRMEAQVANTTAGNDALTLIRENVANGLSIGFNVVRQTWNEDYTARDISEIRLAEISLVAEPAYADAGVTGVRDIDGIPVAELVAAMDAIRAEEALDDDIQIVERAYLALGTLLTPAAPEEVPQSIREDIAALYSKRPF